MNIDLLPFTAFALESGGIADCPADGVQTLTLESALTSARSSREPMSGRASVNQSFAQGAKVSRAAVLPVEDAVLTITF